MNKFLFSDFSKIVLLTTVLFGGTFILTGCFYETNDDIILTFLLNGTFAGQPVSDLTLYLHGFSSIMAYLYRILPGWPWYGLILYGLLFSVSVLAFWFIYGLLKPVLTSAKIYLVITFFYFTTWYEHVFWFNYSRVPLLLAGIAALVAWWDRRPEKSVHIRRLLGCGFLFFLALCIRPSMALYGFVIVLPVLVFSFNSSKWVLKRTIIIILPFLLAGLLFFIGMRVTDTFTQKEYRRYDVLKSQILDYNWCCPPLTQPAHKLLYAGVINWFLADKNMLLFLQQQPTNWNYFWTNTAYLKLIQVLRYLIFDQFMALCLGLIYFVWLIKTKARNIIIPYLGYQVYFWSIIFFTGLLLKIPPRVLTPAVSLFLLTHLAWFSIMGMRPKLPVFIKLLSVLLLCIQIYKINHRVDKQQQRQLKSETVLAHIGEKYPGYLVVAAGLENDLRALSPFKNYNFNNQRLLFITGWQTLDPHYSVYLHEISDQNNLAAAFSSFSEQNKVIWVTSPELAHFLSTYLQSFYQQAFRFKQQDPVKGSQWPENLHYYQVKSLPKP